MNRACNSTNLLAPHLYFLFFVVRLIEQKYYFHLTWFWTYPSYIIWDYKKHFIEPALSMLHFKYFSLLQFKSCLLWNKTWIALSPVKWPSAGGVKKIGNHFKFWTKAAKSRKWLQAHKGYFVKGGKCTWGKRKGPWSTKDFFPLPVPSVTSATH